MNYNSYFDKAREASRKPTLAPALINTVLEDVAAEAIAQTEYILAENQKDLDRMDPADPKYDRLKLTADRIKGIAGDMLSVAKLDSPLG
ncbi:MAG TPA: gamma-glutamyl-phosphate reductase, partial [Mucilaginibacter sp.]